MVLGVLWEASSACYYRAIEPMRVLERRRHEVVWPDSEDGAPTADKLARCDVVHVYRRFDPVTQGVLAQLAANGTGIVWDTDDDLSAIPRESPVYKKTGGVKAQVIHRETIKTAKNAHVMTTTTAALAERYESADIPRIEVIGNYLASRPKRRRRKHDGIVIGWIAALEHKADIARIPVVKALRALLEKHPELRVESVGVDLQLPERYRHDGFLPFMTLADRIGGFDIAIAPLADIPFNATRSDIKVKEYAASKVPWLASPTGPYVGLGEEQGGRLVPDDRWFEELDRLITSSGERRGLARAGKKWAKRERIETEIHRWEAVFEEAEAARGRRGGAITAGAAR
jgi:glycosyltransferase involved in cell wall biosynthesis